LVDDNNCSGAPFDTNNNTKKNPNPRALGTGGGGNKKKNAPMKKKKTAPIRWTKPAEGGGKLTGSTKKPRKKLDGRGPKKKVVDVQKETKECDRQMYRHRA